MGGAVERSLVMAMISAFFPLWERIKRACAGIAQRQAVKKVVLRFSHFLFFNILKNIGFISALAFASFTKVWDRSVDKYLTHRKYAPYTHHHLSFLSIFMKEESMT